MKKKILMGCLMFFAIIGIYSIKVEATFKITNFEIYCIVEENGDIEVQENIEYYTTENKNGLIRTIKTKNEMNSKNSADDVVIEEVLADGEKYNQTTSATAGTSGVYTLKKSNSAYEIKVFSPFNVNVKNITYVYKLSNVAVKYNDIAELYWNFIGSEWDCPIENVEINIRLPETAADETIYVYGHGSDNGTFTKVENYITLTAKKLNAYQALDARILFTNNAIPLSTKKINKNVLNKYINEEEGITLKRDETGILFGYSVNEIAIITSLIIIVIGIYLYLKYDKEYKVEKYKYYREIPCNLEPELLQKIYYGKKAPSAFWITFLNLVKKGVFRIEKTINEVGKETEKIVFQKDVDDLKDYQRIVAEIIIDYMPPDKEEIDILKLQSKMELGSKRRYTEFEERIKWEKKSLFGKEKKAPKNIKKILVGLMIALILLIIAMSFIDPVARSKEMHIGIAMTLGMTTLLYTIFFSAIEDSIIGMAFLIFHSGAFQIFNFILLKDAGIGMMYIPYIMLFILIQYVGRIKKSCKEERQIIEQLKGLRRYLKDYSLLAKKENIENVIIWEDYLIIAIALGLNDKIVDKLYKYGEKFVDSNIERSFNNVGGYMAISSIGPVINSYATSRIIVSSSGSGFSHSSSSFSGSSGSFSGGSSSGGGGRRRRRRKFFLIKKETIKDIVSFFLV